MDGALEVHQVPAWQDNLIWIAVCTQTGQAAAIDGPEARPALDYCERNGLNLTTILNTHIHGDHIGINRELGKLGMLGDFIVYGAAETRARVPGITDAVEEGSVVRIGAVEGQVLETPGHIDGHVSYLFGDVVFCGDTMFAGGCGYLFDGPAATMHESLMRLGHLDPKTRVCCAHEYTEDNLRFAWSVEPENPHLADRIRRVWAIRARGGCTVPSTIGEERATNPFLRQGSAHLRRHVTEQLAGRTMGTPAELFAGTRELKDRKDYRSMTDAQLPLVGGGA